MSQVIDGVSSTVQIGPVTFGTVDDQGVRWRLRGDQLSNGQQSGLLGWGSPLSSIQFVRPPRQRGAWAGDAWPTERVLSFWTIISAPTPALLNQALQLLDSAVSCADTTVTVDEAGFVRTVTARRAGTVVESNKVSSTLAQPTFQMVCPDPRKFGTPYTGSTLLPSVSGGLALPAALPWALDSAVITGQVSATNPGDTDGTVVLRVDGPCTGPVIAHSSGAVLSLNGAYTVIAGNWLEIDMDARTVLENGQASRNEYVTSRGWSAFQPGDNTWSFTAATYSAASRLTVTATPAWQ